MSGVYIQEKVLPALREKSGALLLREVVKRWLDYKFVTRWVARFFFYLDQHFTRRHGYPTMHDTAILILHNHVLLLSLFIYFYYEVVGKLRTMILLNKENFTSKYYVMIYKSLHDCSIVI
jgi:hypothetical protein